MKESILKYIKERQGVSFVELSRDIPGFNGERTLKHATFENLFLWFDLSDEAINALLDLIKNDEVKVRVATPMIYYIDGMVPQLPIAKNLRGYKEPRWLPVTLSTP